MLAEFAAIATAITSLVGVFFLIRRDVKKKNHESWVEKERDLIKQINEAQTNEERAKLVKALHDHRSSNK
jgi:hypothetical protein